MLRALVILLVLVTTSVGWFCFSASSRHFVEKGLGMPAPEVQRAAEVKGLTQLIKIRQRFGSGNLKPDAELQTWLAEKSHEKSTADLNKLVADLQDVFPQYLQVAGFTASSMSLDGLLQKLGSWQPLMDPSMTHCAVSLRPGAFRIGWQGCLITGQRVPDFSPEALADLQQQIYYSECQLCGSGQSCEIPRHTRSISIECPRCRRIYAMLAADKAGHFRYMNEFLTGYQPPAHFPGHQTRLQELMLIWQTVAGQCHYTRDTGTDENDAWQTALETQSMGTGDCEDTSILLADWLIARGFQARVALGRYAERGGHAWVVVRLEDRDYLLESTEGASRAQAPPLLMETGARYVPDMLFDKDAFYTRQAGSPVWLGDYWTDETWLRVVPRIRPPSAVASAHKP